MTLLIVILVIVVLALGLPILLERVSAPETTEKHEQPPRPPELLQRPLRSRYLD